MCRDSIPSPVKQAAREKDSVGCAMKLRGSARIWSRNAARWTAVLCGPMSIPYPPDSPTALTTIWSSRSSTYWRSDGLCIKYVSTFGRMGSSER